MEKEQRNKLQKATQDARLLLEEEFCSQLLQTYDIDVEKVRWAEEPGAHLQAEQRLIREKLAQKARKPNILLSSHPHKHRAWGSKTKFCIRISNQHYTCNSSSLH